MDLPLTQGGSPARGEHAENFPENQRKFPTHGMETGEARVLLEYSQQAYEALMNIPIVWELIVRKGFPPDHWGGAEYSPRSEEFSPARREGTANMVL